MDFSLSASFDIDNGRLGDATQEQCFTLGVSWGVAYERSHRPAGFEQLVRTENAGRIVKMLTARGRRVKVESAALGWVALIVAGLD